MVIVDTRTPEEYSRGCLPGAWSMPGGELVLRIGELVASPEQTIVVHCGGRTRSLPRRRVAPPHGAAQPHRGGEERHDGLAARRPRARARSDTLAARAVGEEPRARGRDRRPRGRGGRHPARLRGRGRGSLEPAQPRERDDVRRTHAGGVRRRARARLELGAGRPGGAGHRRQRGGARGLAGPDLRRLRPLDHDRGLAQAHGLPARGGAGGRCARVAALRPPARDRRAGGHPVRLRRGPPRGRAGAARAGRRRGGAERGSERRLPARAPARRALDRARVGSSSSSATRCPIRAPPCSSPAPTACSRPWPRPR